MDLNNLKNILARWQIRLEFTNRIMNLGFRIVWLVMFCKIFNMPVWGYVLTGVGTITIWVVVSWVLDKMGMISYAQKAIWDRTPAWGQIKEKLNVKS